MLDILLGIVELDPIQEDRNEYRIHWCAFCGMETNTNSLVAHERNCLWLRARALWATLPTSAFNARNQGLAPQEKTHD